MNDIDFSKLKPETPLPDGTFYMGRDEGGQPLIGRLEDDGTTRVYSEAAADIATLLAGDDINAKNTRQETALILTAVNGDIDTARQLIEKGALLNETNMAGETALVVAIRFRHTELAALLIDKGADLNVQTALLQETALITTVYMDDPETLQHLIDKKVALNAQRFNGLTALMMSIVHGRQECFDRLVDAKADLTLQGDARTPLSMAVLCDQLDFAQTLLDHGVPINQVNENGMTALIEAAENGRKEAVEFLLAHGADFDVTYDGQDACAIAREKGHDDIACILEQARKDRDAVIAAEKAALEKAENDRHEAVQQRQLILKRNAPKFKL